MLSEEGTKLYIKHKLFFIITQISIAWPIMDQIVPPPQIHVHPEPQKVILFGNRVFENVISQDELILD